MDVGFTEEQELLRTSAQRFLENECPSAFVRQRMAEPAAMTDDFWQKLAGQGWFGILYPAFGDATSHRERVARLLSP